jgi:hypothetical protein
MSKSNKNLNKNLNKNQEVSMEELENSVEKKSFLAKSKEFIETHKKVIIMTMVSTGAGVALGSWVQRKKLEREMLENDSYEDDHIDDVECLELMNEDNMSNETEEVVE